MATRTIANGGGNWSATGTWVEGAVPTASDDVVATGTSGHLTIDAAAACRSIDFTGFTNTVTHNASVTLSIGTSTANGTLAMKMVAGMTYTPNSGSSSILTFVSTSATQLGVTTAGKTLGTVSFNGAGGSWQFQDSFTALSTGTLTLTTGALDLNGQTVSVAAFMFNGFATRSLTMDAAQVTCTTSGSVVWNASTTGSLTFSAGTSTIIVSNAAASGTTFAGGGLTYNNLTVNWAGAGTNHITGSNHFNTLAFTGNAKTVDFVAGTTQTCSSFTTASVSGQVYTFKSVTPASAWNLSSPSGTVSCDYLSLTDSAAAGGATWLAGSHSTNVSGNSGWIFPQLTVTQQGRLRVLGITTAAVAARVRVSGIGIVTQSVKVRVQIAGIVMQPGWVRVAVLGATAQTGRVRVGVPGKTIQTGRVHIAGVVNGVAIQISRLRVATGTTAGQSVRMRLAITAVATQSGFVRVRSGGMATQSGRIRISLAGPDVLVFFWFRLIPTRWRFRRESAMGVLPGVTYQTVLAISTVQSGRIRVQASPAEAQSARSRISTGVVATQSAQGRVATTATVSQPGRVSVAPLGGQIANQAARTRITAAVTATRSGRLRVRAAGTVTQAGRLRVRSVAVSAQTARVNIAIPPGSRFANQAGRTRLKTSPTATQTGRLRVQGAGIVDGRDIRNNTSLVGIQVTQGSLTVHNGDYNAVDGEHVTGLWIKGTLNLPHASTGGLVTNCKIDGGGGPDGCGVDNYSGGQLSTGWLVQYCTIGSKTISPGWSQLCNFGGVDFQYCEIIGGGTDCASSMNGGGEMIDACWIHGFSSTGNDGQHSDLLQVSSGSGQQITRNYFIQESFNAQAEQDASIIVKSDEGAISDVLIGHNLFMVDPSQVPWNQCLVVIDEFVFSGGTQGDHLSNVTLDTNYIQAGVFGGGGVLNANITPATTTNFWVDSTGVLLGAVVNFGDGNYPHTNP